MSLKENENNISEGVVQEERTASKKARLDLGKYIAKLAVDRNIDGLLPLAERYQETDSKGDDQNEMLSEIYDDQKSLSENGASEDIVSEAKQDEASNFQGEFNEQPDEALFNADDDGASGEYSRLASAKKWDDIITLAETVLQSASGDTALKARLWWVRAQIVLDSMPSGILAVPLDTVSREVVEKCTHSRTDPALLNLTESVLLITAKKLCESEDYEFGNLFFERAYKINRKNGEVFFTALQKELLLLQAKPCTRSVSARIEVVEKKVAELKNALKTTEIKKIKDEDKSDFSSVKKDGTGISDHLNLQEERKVGNSTGILGLIFILAVLGVGWMAFDRFPSLLGYLGEIINVEVVEQGDEVVSYAADPVPQLQLPLATPVAPLRADSLGGILRVLDSNTASGSDSDKGSIVKDDLKDEKIPQRDVSVAKVAAEKTGSADTKTAVINTKSPLEPHNLRVAVEAFERGDLVDAVGGRGRDLIDSSREIDRVNKPIVAGHGSTDPIIPAYMIPLGKNSATKMREIKRMTEVYAAPRSSAAKVDTLISGDRVRVAKIRRGWVEILSQSGRPGYIREEFLKDDVWRITD
ncbi:MAG: SH3 domain-containing protein [Bdellovibrionota bacterium]|jgi:hypothetical protein